MSTQILSDKNVTQTKSVLVAKNRPYSDLDMSLTLHPDFHDIIPLTDIDAVKNSVKNLVLTNFNERPFNLSLGSNSRAFLFEPADRFTAVALRRAINSVLIKYEPRIDQITVQIQDNIDENRYDITIGFRVITLNTLITVDLYLVRIR